jgi:ribonuclease E
LRDLAGLVVIDFIDMEDARNNRAVERRLKDNLKSDRARVQIGRISNFGLLELSRQRLRPSLYETSSVPCPHCAGSGYMRSTESAALHVLRAIEEEAVRERAAQVSVHVPTTIALYLLNQKRDHVNGIQERYGLRALIYGADDLIPPNFRLEVDMLRSEGESRTEARQPVPEPMAEPAPLPADEEDAAEPLAQEMQAEGRPPQRVERGPREDGERGDGRRRRRRRRRRPGETGSQPEQTGMPVAKELAASEAAPSPPGEISEAQLVPEGETGESRRRRRGRRGGRRRQEYPSEARMPPGTEQPFVEPTPAAVSWQATPPPLWAGAPGEPPPVGEQPAMPSQASVAADAAPPTEPTPMQPAAQPRRDHPAASLPEAAMLEPAPAAGPPVTEGEKQSSTATAPAPQPEPEPELPPSERRRGWWQRRFSLR